MSLRHPVPEYLCIYVNYLLYIPIEELTRRKDFIVITSQNLVPCKICHHSAFRAEVREILPEYVRIYVNYLLYTSSYGGIALYL